MKIYNAIRLCAIVTLSPLFFAGAVSATKQINSKAGEVKSASQEEKISNGNIQTAKTRAIGISIFSFAILTTITVVAREIRSSQPKQQQIMSKYYRR
jgi:hypothetical protein